MILILIFKATHLIRKALKNSHLPFTHRRSLLQVVCETKSIIIIHHKIYNLNTLSLCHSLSIAYVDVPDGAQTLGLVQLSPHRREVFCEGLFLVLKLNPHMSARVPLLQTWKTMSCAALHKPPCRHPSSRARCDRSRGARWRLRCASLCFRSIPWRHWSAARAAAHAPTSHSPALQAQNTHALYAFHLRLWTLSTLKLSNAIMHVRYAGMW